MASSVKISNDSEPESNKGAKSQSRWSLLANRGLQIGILIAAVVIIAISLKYVSGLNNAGSISSAAVPIKKATAADAPVNRPLPSQELANDAESTISVNTSKSDGSGAFGK